MESETRKPRCTHGAPQPDRVELQNSDTQALACESQGFITSPSEIWKLCWGGDHW